MTHGPGTYAGSDGDGSFPSSGLCNLFFMCQPACQGVVFQRRVPEHSLSAGAVEGAGSVTATPRPAPPRPTCDRMICLLICFRKQTPPPPQRRLPESRQARGGSDRVSGSQASAGVAQTSLWGIPLSHVRNVLKM
ncbi:hypothetical protein SKAU_G00003360 [Synaphobranchus kaupii]|uniref:Uncharacterized protein n=1 Tax=Synaphobranchus kaupii TaxID=118154 RepID=A0A9Q1JBF8_SYNKA|nr:hypothetical protein SKAU_G00003360 [Synaphobranchus kaupii]